MHRGVLDPWMEEEEAGIDCRFPEETKNLARR